MTGFISALALTAVIGLASLVGARSPAFRNRWILDLAAVRHNREYDRLLTSCGLHFSPVHFLVNGATICLFGAALADVLGGAQMLVVFFASALGGALMTCWINRRKRHEAWGASAAACGLVCAYTLVGRESLPLLPAFLPLWSYALLFLVASYFAHNRRKETISHSAHLGGALGGIVIAALYAPSLVAGSERVNWLPLFVLLATRVYFAIWPREQDEAQLRKAGADGLPDLHYRAYRSEISDHNPNIRYQRYDEAARAKHDRGHMDMLLDKISRHGPDSLTDREKRELERMSRRYRRTPDETS